MKRAEIAVASLLTIGAACGIGFALNFAFGAQTQIAAVTLGGALIAMAAALVVWEHELMPHRDDVEEMPDERSQPPDRAAAQTAFASGMHEIVGRRPWLVRLLAGAAGIVGIAFLAPLRSLAPNYGSALAQTSWRGGARLVRADGSLVRAGELAIDGVVTVFPEGHVGPNDSDDMANTATMLIRVPPDALQLDAAQAANAPQGYIAYSKVCTHAGCPVALYRAAQRQLFCPCHQSTFDVLRGGVPVFGPAARALPQLPLRIAADGTLEASADFDQPIGPGYWDRP